MSAPSALLIDSADSLPSARNELEDRLARIGLGLVVRRIGRAGRLVLDEREIHALRLASPVLALIGPMVGDQVSAARQTHQLLPETPIVLLAGLGRQAKLRQHLSLTPLLGQHWAIADPETNSLEPALARLWDVARTQARLKDLRASLEAARQQAVTSRPHRLAGILSQPGSLEHLLDALDTGLVLLDQEGRVQGWNHAAESLLGLRQSLDSGPFGRALVELVEPALAFEIGRAIEAAHHATRLEHSRIVIGEFSSSAGAGQVLALDVAPVESANNGGMFCLVIRDVTRLHAAEMATQQHSERLAVAVRAGNIGLWEWEIARDQLHMSSEACLLLGLAPEEPPKTFGALLDAFEDEQRDALVRALADAEPGSSFRIEMSLPGSAQQLWREISGRALPAAPGIPARALGAISDISGHIRTRHELSSSLALAQRSQALAEDASRARDEVLSLVSHEMRTPLNAVSLALDLLEEAGDDSETRTLATEGLRHAVVTQARLVEDLLDLSRALVGRLVLRPAHLDLRQMLEQAAKVARVAAAARDIAIDVVLPPDLGAIEADAVRLGQLVGNLLANGTKFSAAGQRVELSAERTADLLVVRVRDWGQGIAADNLERIFDRLWSTDRTTSRRDAGLGLGLSIARAIAESHGGTLNAASPGPGQGATFTFLLPLAPPPVEPGA